MGKCVYVAVHRGRRRRAELHVVVWSLFLFKQYVIYEPLTAIPVLSLFQVATETWRDREIYPKYYQVNGKQALTEWCALTSPQRTSLLSLFTQQPCAVADCMVMNILVPWFYSARVGADVLGEASSSVPGGETGGFFGRTIAGRIVVSVLSLHEQRTGWSSRHRESVEGRRAVYNNNTVPVTSRDWQPPRPLGGVFSHQQHAIFGKWLHHWGSTTARGRRDFRRDFQFVVQNRDNESVGPFSSLTSQLYRYS